MLILASCALVSLVCVLSVTNKPRPTPPVAQAPPPIIIHRPVPPPTPIPLPQTPESFNISNPIPGYQNYQKIIAQIRQWHEEAPEITSVGTYGKTSRGQDIYYLRVGKNGAPKVMITACIHGNESLCTSVLMAYVGTILSKYGKDKEITDLLDTRNIYFIPVCSPDSYPHSRHVDGVDPNRDFPTRGNPSKRSVPPVQALRDFFLKHKFRAAISMHTFGRMVLLPPGDHMGRTANDADYRRIAAKMSENSQYEILYAHKLYNRPIVGGELDWYHANKAFAIVLELGEHQRIATRDEILYEFRKTFPGILYFLKEAPAVEIKQRVRRYSALRHAA